MTRLHNPAPAGEVLRSAAAAAATFADRSTFASTPRRRFETRPAVRPEPAVLRRHPHIVRYPDVEADFDALIDKATAAIAGASLSRTRSSGTTSMSPRWCSRSSCRW